MGLVWEYWYRLGGVGPWKPANTKGLWAAAVNIENSSYSLWIEVKWED